MSFPRALGGNPFNNALILLKILVIGSPIKALVDDRKGFSEVSN